MSQLLLLDLSGMDEQACFDHGFELYKTEYLNQTDTRGELPSHDNQAVVFYADRYDHAFRTSADRVRRAHDKSKIAVDRIARIYWIKELIAKSAATMVCREKSPPDRWQRAYYCYTHCYVVWLEPQRIVNGRPIGWKFSSAYPVPVAEFNRTTYGFKTVK